MEFNGNDKRKNKFLNFKKYVSIMLSVIMLSSMITFDTNIMAEDIYVSDDETLNDNVDINDSTTDGDDLDTDDSTTDGDDLDTDDSTTDSDDLDTDDSTTDGDDLDTDDSTTDSDDVGTDDSTTDSDDIDTDDDSATDGDDANLIDNTTLALSPDLLGNYQLILPDKDIVLDGETIEALPSGTTYDLNLHIIHYTINSDGTYEKVEFNNNYDYEIDITDSSGNTTSETITMQPVIRGEMFKTYDGLVSNIGEYSPGTSVTLKDVLISNKGETGDQPLFSYVLVGSSAVSSNPEEYVYFGSMNPIPLYSQKTSVAYARTTPSTDKYPTDATYANTYSGDTAYKTERLLTNFNAVSLHEIEGWHIVGPVLSIDETVRTRESFFQFNTDIQDNVTAAVSVADYSAGKPSYIGKIMSLTTSEIASAVLLDYGFDLLENPSFETPNLYTREDNLYVFTKDDSYTAQTLQIVRPQYASATFESPNAGGLIEYNNERYNGSLYQNDDFIDLEKLKENIYADTKTLHLQGTLEYQRQDEDLATDSSLGKLITIESKHTPREYIDRHNSLTSATESYRDEVNGFGQITYLNVEVGNSYIIEDATALKFVNLLLPEDYGYSTNNGLVQTTISFEGDTLLKKSMAVDASDDGTKETAMHSVFPSVYLNGTYMPTGAGGRDTEYSEVGNKVIWNFPNLVTGKLDESITSSSPLSNGKTYDDYKNVDDANNRLSLNVSQNIPGHILAPHAEVWNYYSQDDSDDAVPSWSGGNINGGIIAKSIHMGVMEMHMWPYNGDSSIAATIGITKSFNNNDWDDDREFTFVLDYGILDNGNTQDSTAINTRIPQEVTVTEDMSINFPYIYFSTPGTYRFQIYEKIPQLGDEDYDATIQYDQSLYMVEIEVAYVDENANSTDADYKVMEIVEQKIYLCKDSDGIFLANPEDGLSAFPEYTDSKLAVFVNYTYPVGQTHVTLYGDKTYDAGDLSTAVFRFLLDVDTDKHTEYKGTNSTNPDGFINTADFPTLIHSDLTGKISFPTLNFNKEGSYYFKIYEIPRDLETFNDDFDNVLYDQSIYSVQIDVSIDTVNSTIDNTILETDVTITKIQDQYGNTVNESINTIGGINFSNSTKLPIMPRTGGIGVYIFYFIGFILLSLAMFLMYNQKRKDEKM